MPVQEEMSIRRLLSAQLTVRSFTEPMRNALPSILPSVSDAMTRKRSFPAVRINASRVPSGESDTCSRLGKRPYTSRGAERPGDVTASDNVAIIAAIQVFFVIKPLS
jgi:hypothetical protein